MLTEDEAKWFQWQGQLAQEVTPWGHPSRPTPSQALCPRGPTVLSDLGQGPSPPSALASSPGKLVWERGFKYNASVTREVTHKRVGIRGSGQEEGKDEPSVTLTPVCVQPLSRVGRPSSDRRDYGLPGSSVYGILQARILE